MQIIPIKILNIKTCFIQFLWCSRLKCWFKGQIISRTQLSLPNAYKVMCFDRNINGNKDVTILEVWLMSCVTVRETHFSFKMIWLILIWKLKFRFFCLRDDYGKRNKINMICMTHQYVSHKFSMLGLPALSLKQASCLWYV